MQTRAASQHLKAFATIDPKNLSASDKGMNLIGGEWKGTENYLVLPDPMTGKPMISIPDTSVAETSEYIDSLK
jgi:hypothetical protein